MRRTAARGGGPSPVAKRPRAATRPHAYDAVAVERAVGALLEAMGLDRDAPDLAETPARVAASWKDEILDGYGLDPGELLG